MGLNAFAKSIDSDQLAQSAYADLNRNVLLLDSFFTLSQTVPPPAPTLLLVCSTSLLKNTVLKVKIARNEQFLLFPQWLFSTIWRTFMYSHQI